MEKILAPEPVLVRKPCEFPVTLDLKHRPPLGAEFEATQDRKALLVRVVSAGAFADWNRQHPLLAIQKGDRIVAVNHRSADAQAMLTEIRVAGVLRMLQWRGQVLNVPYYAPSCFSFSMLGLLVGYHCDALTSELPCLLPWTLMAVLLTLQDGKMR
eukprot:g16156.t2